MGYNPEQGNPGVSFLVSLIAPLSRQHQYNEAFQGRLAPSWLTQLDPNATQEQKDAAKLAGLESARQNVQQVAGDMSGGGTSAYTPQGGQDFLRSLSTMISGNPTNPSQAGLQTWLNASPSNAWQTVMDMIGGGMSPMFNNNQQLQQRTMSRLYQMFQNEGTGNGGNFLSWLVRQMGTA